MKRFVVITSLVLASPAWAQDADEAPSLMERGAQMFLEGLMAEVDPRLDELQDLAREFGPAMRDFFAEMGPAFGELLSKVEDWSAYHPPEILPNGDIIMRRKADTPPAEPPAAEDPGENDPIDL